MLVCCSSHPATAASEWLEIVAACKGRVVRAEGLEPPQLSSLEPKSSASTNSATPARRHQRASRSRQAPPGGAAYIMVAQKHHRNRIENRRVQPVGGTGSPQAAKTDNQPGWRQFRKR